MVKKLNVTTNPKVTVGAQAAEAVRKEIPGLNAIEVEQEAHKEYEQNVLIACESGKKMHEGDFYIVVITKRERLLNNVLRNYFFTRLTCPTPDWEQAVYSYKKADDAITFLWVLPCAEACEYMTRNARYIVPQERQLLEFVLRLNDGSLDALAKQLNGEKKDSLLLDK
jgi:hypothetical protein